MTAYLVALVPTLVLMLGWTLISAPRVLATVHDSFGLQFDRIGAASGFAEVTLAVLRLVMLVLPVAAISLSLGRSGRMAGRGLVGWSRGSVARRAAAVAVVAAVAGAVGYMWWPNGEYEPIRPGERGTIGETLMAIPEFAGGRPSFTKERERDVGSTSTVREQEAERRAHDDGPADPSATPAPREDDTTPRAPEDEPTDDPQESQSAPSESAAPDPTDDPGNSPPAASPGAGSTSEPNAPAPTVEPSATATAEATSTPTAEPTATSTATPSPASTQAPTPANTAPTESPAPTEAAPAESPAPTSAAPAESTAPAPTSTP